MDADTIPLAISVSGASKRKRGVAALAVCGGVVPSEKALGGVQGSARDLACPAAKRQSPVTDANVHRNASERAAGAAELPRVGASAEGVVWSGAPRGAALGALHERLSQLRAANSVSAAAAQFGMEEDMDAAGGGMGGGVPVGALRDPVRAEVAASRAEGRRLAELQRGGLSEQAGLQVQLRAQAEVLIGRLTEAYTRLGRKQDAQALVLGRGVVSQARVDKLKASLDRVTAAIHKD